MILLKHSLGKGFNGFSTVFTCEGLTIFDYILSSVKGKFVFSIKKLYNYFNCQTMSTTTNTNQASSHASFVVDVINGETEVIVAHQKEENTKQQAQPVSGFAKNIRYSIYNNGGGYTGL